jgi:hypothetical protein
MRTLPDGSFETMTYDAGNLETHTDLHGDTITTLKATG